LSAAKNCRKLSEKNKKNKLFLNLQKLSKAFKSFQKLSGFGTAKSSF
jgi:hypothetical protein